MKNEGIPIAVRTSLVDFGPNWQDTELALNVDITAKAGKSEAVCEYIESCRKCEYYNAKKVDKTRFCYEKWYGIVNVASEEAEDHAKNHFLDCVMCDTLINDN